MTTVHPLRGGRAWHETMALPVKVRDRLVPETLFVDLDGDGEQPALRMKIEVRQGVPVCTELRLTARPGGRDVQRSDLRAVRIDSWIEQAVAVCSYEQTEDGAITKSAPAPADFENVRQVRRNAPRSGRPKVPPNGCTRSPISTACTPTGAAAGRRRRARSVRPHRGPLRREVPQRRAATTAREGIGEMSRRRQLPPQIRKITVTDRSTGKSLCATRLQWTPGSARIPVSAASSGVGSSPRQHARAALAAAQAGVAAGTYVHASRLTVEQACEAWLASKHSLKPSTLRGPSGVT